MRHDVESCSSCLKSPLELRQDKLKACGLCFIPKYCSKECQVAHWKAEHKRSCLGNGKVKELLKRLRSWVYESEHNLLTAAVVANINPLERALCVDIKFLEGAYQYVSHRTPLLEDAGPKALEMSQMTHGEYIVVAWDDAIPGHAITTAVKLPYPIVLDGGVTVAHCINLPSIS